MNPEQIQWTEKVVSIGDLKPAKYNPRKISRHDFESLKRSLTKFGHAYPVVCNRDLTIIGGHQTVKAAKELGWKEIKASIPNMELGGGIEKSLNLALNRIDGEWEEDRLIMLLANIEEKNEDLLNTTGFDDKELEFLLDKVRDFESGEEDKLTLDNIKKTKIHKGDLFEIDGRHRILCGDSTNVDNYKSIFQNSKIDLVMTSPPYNVNLGYSEYKDDKPVDEYFSMIKATLSNIKEFMNKSRYLCVNLGNQCNMNISAHYSNIMEKMGLRYSRTIYWIKPYGAAIPSTSIRNPFPRWYTPVVNTESIIIHSNDIEKDPEFLEVMLVYSDRTISAKDRPDKNNTKKIDKAKIRKYITNVWRMQPETTLSKSHPAHYPIQLPRNCIEFYSLEGENIFDPFLGSGTTILAAEELKRKGYGIDLDPKYVELALRRYKIIHPNAEIECLNRKLTI